MGTADSPMGDRASRHPKATKKAEVTAGGVDTAELSSKTMECTNVKGLFFIGEVGRCHGTTRRPLTFSGLGRRVRPRAALYEGTEARRAPTRAGAAGLWGCFRFFGRPQILRRCL